MEPEDFWGTGCARGWKEKKRNKEYVFLNAAPLHSDVPGIDSERVLGKCMPLIDVSSPGGQAALWKGERIDLSSFHQPIEILLD